jgi:predicted nucleotidyltransferase
VFDRQPHEGAKGHSADMTTLSTPDAASDTQLPVRVQTYLEALVQTRAQDRAPLISVVLFGSAAKGGFSGDVSDVDLIVVVSDDVPRTQRRRLAEEVARLEALHGLRAATTQSPGRLRMFIERVMGHGFSCFVCTRSDLISGDVARVLGVRPLETPFVDRIVFASIVASAVTVYGEDLLPHVAVPSVRRLDVFKALFTFSNQVLLSAVAFPALPDATKYAMGALKHSLHSCFFCYHQRTAAVEEEVDFFQRRMGPSQTLVELLALRRKDRRSFAFVIRCLPAIVRLHVRTAWDNRFPAQSSSAQ